MCPVVQGGVVSRRWWVALSGWPRRATFDGDRRGSAPGGEGGGAVWCRQDLEEGAALELLERSGSGLVPDGPGELCLVGCGQCALVLGGAWGLRRVVVGAGGPGVGRRAVTHPGGLGWSVLRGRCWVLLVRAVVGTGG